MIMLQGLHAILYGMKSNRHILKSIWSSVSWRMASGVLKQAHCSCKSVNYFYC